MMKRTVIPTVVLLALLPLYGCELPHSHSVSRDESPNEHTRYQDVPAVRSDGSVADPAQWALSRGRRITR